MTARKMYEAIAEREGAWWVLRVPSINAATQARRLDQAEAMVRDLIYGITDEDPESFDVVVTPDIGPDMTQLVVTAAAASARASVAQLEASIAIREAAEASARAGLTNRDIGRLIGVSHQRVQQLLADKTHTDVLRDRLRRELMHLDDSRTISYEVPLVPVKA